MTGTSLQHHSCRSGNKTTAPLRSLPDVDVVAWRESLSHKGDLFYVMIDCYMREVGLFLYVAN